MTMFHVIPPQRCLDDGGSPWAEIASQNVAAAFAEAERDRIRERIGQVKADQKARGRYLGGKVPFGFRRGTNGELVAHEAEQEAIREIVAMRGEGKALRAIAEAVQARGHRISHEGVAGVLRAAGI
jgi:putative DNA-invertase from lambdoid prophage Rac